MRATILLCSLLALALPARADDHGPVPVPNSVAAALAESVSYALRVTDNNLVGMTITNYGFLGNNFVSRSPSLEYPLGTGYEHLLRGGLWIGARAIDEFGAFTGVATATVDGFEGSSSQSATEFTPAGRAISARSSLLNSVFFNPDAVSELDLISRFSDRPARRALNNNEDHRPMQVLVRQDNYLWSFSDYQNVAFFHYTITNLGPPLADVWVGIYSEFASGDKNSYTSWPPGARWYSKKWIVYDDSLRLFREHYCENVPTPDQATPDGCRLPVAPYWMGLKLLGVSPGDIADTSDKKVTMQAWRWLPGSPERDQDVERYAIMSAGTVSNLNSSDVRPASGDPVAVFAVGPFRQIDPGDSVSVDFAIVGGAEVFDIQRNARTAQRAFDRGYIVPVPPPSPRFHIVARSHALDFYWDDSPESAPDSTSPNPLDFEGYRVYVGEDRLALNRVAEFDRDTAPNDTIGYNTGMSRILLDPPVVIEGDTCNYKFTVEGLRDGFKYYGAVTSFDVGSSEIESLESGISQNKLLSVPSASPAEAAGRDVTVYPNPYRVEARWDQGRSARDHYLWFTNLPVRCTLRVFTLSGDLVFETEFDGATYHGQGARGIYDPRRELDVDPPTLSGTTFGWDMISKHNQAIASGLYLFSVEDHGGGKRQVGKFLVVKSDREDF